MTDKAGEIIADFDRCRGERGNYNNQWEAISRLMFPTQWFIQKLAPGARRNIQIFSSIGVKCVTDLASGIHGLLTNAGGEWFFLRDPDEEINNQRDVQLWLQDTVRRMRFVFSSQEFAFDTNAQEVYKNLVAFGNACMLMQESEDKGLRFQSLALNNCYFRNNEYDEIDTVYRLIQWSPVQAANVFGKDKLSDSVRQKLDDPAARYEPTDYVHSVYPRTNTRAGSYLATDKPFASCYVDYTNKKLISEGGFDRLPYLTPRWDKVSGEVYGYGPGAMMLPDVSVANEAKRDTLQAFAVAVRPPFLTPANGMSGPLVINPGAINTFRSGTSELPRPMMTGANPDAGQKFLEMQNDEISKGFFLDKLSLPQLDRATAYEMSIRRGDNMTQISPIISRQQKEWLSPLVTGVFRWMFKRGMLAPPPPQLRGRYLAIDYVSPMAQSQRMTEVQSIISYMQYIGSIAQFKPEVLDNLNPDALATWPATLMNVSQQVIQDPAVRDQERQSRQQQAQAQQQAALMESLAGSAKDGTKAISQLQTPAAA